MKVKLTLEYAGEEFSGWQRQEGLPTVQGSLEHALRIVFQGYAKKHHSTFDAPVAITGSGRTDAGVHARGQVASFSWPAQFEFDAYRVQSSLNALTPSGLGVVGVELKDDSFDARFTPHVKCYQYRMLMRTVRPALEKHRILPVRTDIDVESMIRAARLFAGQRDFESFRARDCSAQTTVRTLHFSELSRVGEDELVFTVHGKGFLKQMIRIMVGTLLEIGAGRRTPDYIRDLIELRDRTKAGPTVPPDGLYLQWVRYTDGDTSGQQAGS